MVSATLVRAFAVLCLATAGLYHCLLAKEICRTMASKVDSIPVPFRCLFPKRFFESQYCLWSMRIGGGVLVMVAALIITVSVYQWMQTHR